MPFEALPVLVLALDAPPPPALPFLVFPFMFMPLMLPFVVVVIVAVLAAPPVVEALVDVVVVVLLLVVFALPLVFSVVQPLQKTATASRAKSAKVLRIEFFSCTLWVRLL